MRGRLKHFWGLEGLTGAAQERVSEANVLYLNAMALADRVSALGGVYAWEHPADRGPPVASIWVQPEMQELEDRCGARRAIFDQCMLGAPTTKKTCLSGNIDGLGDLDGLTCDGSHTHQQQPINNNNQPRGRPQLLLNTDELRKRTGKKYCDEAELVPLLLAHGLIRRVRTIAVEVRPLSGESFDIKLNAKAPTVGEAKEQIERDEGTKPRSQLLCRVQVSSDGSNVREFDQEPEELKEDGMALEEGDVIAMGVMPEPVQWRTWPADRVTVSEDGKLATQIRTGVAMVTTGEELTEGRHYWEVESTVTR